jgi:O-succinylbenzoate synthase
VTGVFAKIARALRPKYRPGLKELTLVKCVLSTHYWKIQIPILNIKFLMVVWAFTADLV